MKSTSTFLTATDGKRLAVRSWVPDAVRVLGSPARPEPATSDGGDERAPRAPQVRTDVAPELGSPRAVLQVVHGMAEHSGRYRRLAAAACARGLAVVADDHRGHGATIAADDERGHTGDASSWRQLLRDQDVVRDEIARTWPDAPVILLGHSWGSLIVRGSLARCDRRRVVGAVVMGTAGDPGALGRVGRLLALAEARARGPRHPSAVLESQIIAPYNAPFAPARTVVDWLTRDESEVSSYLADPLCGFTCTAGFYRDLLEAGLAVSSSRAFESIPCDLPLLVASGAEDPVGGAGKGVTEVATRMRRAGVRDVTLRLYPGARHELLNETNREEVTRDLLAWVEEHLPERRLTA
ncbi:alpha/beta hydrolase [Actinomyces radicidentis]|uniref:alpha/beta hydrolase n=1 Tax=Actinomyces radicidentis TaxID=111015 RepID=UPI0028EF913F|nr:alpha/beta hydrolase [Actinomyces radicidentis]